jgi:4'-phosphopantetheinyl transferase
MTGAMNIRSLPENCIHVYYVRIDSAKDFAQSEMRILSSQEQEMLQKLQRASDRRSYATAHCMLRRVLADYSGESPDALQFGRSEFGKPFLAQAPNEKAIEFNLTHCESLVACAIARVAVGIDVEPVTRVLDAEVAKIILSSKERAALESLPPTTRQHRLLQLWTFKEASLKALGKGLYHEPSKVEINVENGDFASALILQTPPCSPIRCQLFDVSITPADHFLSVATTVPGSYQLSSFDFDI